MYSYGHVGVCANWTGFNGRVATCTNCTCYQYRGYLIGRWLSLHRPVAIPVPVHLLFMLLFSRSCFSFLRVPVPVHLIHRISYSTGPTPYPCACAYPCACSCAYYTRLPPGQLIILPALLPGSWLPAAVAGINPWALGHRHVPCTRACTDQIQVNATRNALLVLVHVLYSQQPGRQAGLWGNV